MFTWSIYLLFGLFLYLTAFDISKKACTTYSYLTPRELKRMNSTCEEIYGNVWILQNKTSYQEMMRVFSSVKRIYGCVTIRNTAFKDLDFFANLQKIECQQNEVQALMISDSFVIYGNPKLIRVDLPMLKSTNISPNEKENIIIGKNSPAFCTNVNDFDIFGNQTIIYRNCKEDVGCSFLRSKKTDGSQIPENCTMISWPIILKGKIKKKYLDRLQTVEVMYNSLILHNTDIVELNMPNLKLIYRDTVFSHKYCSIYLDGNKQLRKIAFHLELQFIEGGGIDYKNTRIEKIEFYPAWMQKKTGYYWYDGSTGTHHYFCMDWDYVPPTPSITGFGDVGIG